MQHVPGAWLLALLNAAVLLAAVGVAGLVLAGRGRTPEDAGPDWHESARELGGEVRRAAEPDAVPVDPDRLARRLLPLASRLRSHARSAPASADAATYRQLHRLATDCQAVAIEYPRSSSVVGPFLEDRLASLRDSARELEQPAD